MNKQYFYLLLLIALPLFGSRSAALAFKFVEKDDQGTHVRAPFVHVDVGNPDQDGKRVKVKAPFVKVDNPPGQGNAQVKAPLTHVTRDAHTGATQVRAPFAKVEKPTAGTNYSRRESKGAVH